MKRICLLSFWMAAVTMVNGQEFSADKLIDLLSLTAPKLENQLFNKKYQPSETEWAGDTAVSTFEYYPAIRFSKKKQADTISRKFIRSVLKETFELTYQTTSAAEYKGIIAGLKKKGFYCEYEKDSVRHPASYLYQHEDYTADASIKVVEDTAWYSIAFFKKILAVNKEIYFAEDLFQFTSHEYLVFYFGEKNVKKDIYYFGGNDIVKCSVLMINSKRQVIFIWRDQLNRSKISNLLLGGYHRLKSQQGNDKPGEKDSVITENSWMLKCGIRVGMPLYELRDLNERNIAFCGGDAPNPGLIFGESSGKVDFKNKDVILACMNCSDEKFLHAKIMYADKAMKEGNIFFILTVILYPPENRIFE
jgi:hypothetical protein